MKKFLLGFLLLFGVAAFAQNTFADVQDGMFVGFRRPEDGVFVIYDAKGKVEIQDGKFAVKIQTTDLKLSKFLAITDFSNTLDEARGRLGLPPVSDLAPANAPPSAPSTGDEWKKGQYRVIYGSSFEREKGELNTGDASFNFVGQDVSYPVFGYDKPSTDKLVVMDFPTHSIINFAGTDFKSMIQMTLTDETGNVVWQLYDTKGGYHPQLQVNARGNNHPDDANRWVAYGKYKLKVKNLSTDARANQTIQFSTTKGTDFWTYILSPGNEATYDLDIHKLPDEYDSYKLNCNVFTRPTSK
jgi:hypothetical protein